MQKLPVPIIRSKLYPTPVAPDTVRRERLLALAPAVASSPVTLICAPAGYGKSTLASNWLARIDCKSAWLSLDPSDGEITSFLSYFVAALRTAFPGCCPDTGDCLKMPSLPPVEELAGVLCNDLDRIDEPVVLALDDYSQVSSSQVHELVDAILRRPPRNLHLVIVCRRDPALSLQTLRASGVLNEVRMQDLAFTEEEAREFIRLSLGDSISRQAVATLHQRTEGWPVALRLAMLAARDRGSASDFADRIPGDIHTIRGYLLQEVLALCSLPVRQYLLRTCFLDRFCAPLCEAVLSDSFPGDAGDPAVLSGEDFMDRIRGAGLFSIALDGTQKWFRYHHLFQSMLQEQASSELGDDEIRAVHFRASRWLEDQGYLEEAIGHLLAADQPSGAAALMVRQRKKVINSEQWLRLEGWLRLLPPGMVSTRPELLLLKARFLRTRGSREEAWQALEQAEALLPVCQIDGDLQRELRGSLESSRCFQLYAMSDGVGAAASARRALEWLPHDCLAERGFAMIILAAALQMTGEVESARKMLYEAMSVGSGVDAHDATLRSRLLVGLCFVHWMQGDLGALRPPAQEVISLASTADLGEALAVASSQLGAVLYHRNELSAVHSSLQELLGRKAFANAEFHSECLIISSLAHQEQGNAPEAARIADALHVFALRTQNAFLIAHSEAFLAELALRQGRPAEADTWANRYDPARFTPMYSFYSPPMTLAKALVLSDTRESRKRAAALLDRLVEYLTGVHNVRFLIETLALRAMLHDATGDRATAMLDLESAISLAHPGRFIRLFVDLGPRLGRLLSRLALQDDRLVYVGEILAAFRQRPAEPLSDAAIVQTGRHEVGVEPLSEREQQILELLANRLSNKEIAERLSISAVTVKRHSANIYQKLGVHSRRQAAAKAAGLGMLHRAK
jgi:LuxR family maltose regulon positive regulatory protein